ncbi:MAG: hypothetical protein R2762_22370 [Bryobacteraceae bacterium]
MFRLAALYFAIVFGTGFLLGPIRLLVLVPRLGSRWAELAEMPVMLAAIVCAARWIVRRTAPPLPRRSWQGVGLIALVLMLAAEFGLVLQLRGIPLAEYFATRDPVSATAYYLSLLAFAAMPAEFARRQRR